jgi:DNA-3-methyladenine glycosylase
MCGGRLSAVKSLISTLSLNQVLPRSFYERSTVLVARELLGKLLVHGKTSGIIVETEAYLGQDDLAAHSAAGITGRTKVIFGPPGHAYIYLNYGIHQCLNLIAEPDGKAGGVLIRALEPVDGVKLMQKRRGGGTRPLVELTSGPGKLTQALGIGSSLNGADVTDGPLVVRHRDLPPAISSSPRIGITKSADLPLRFFVEGNPFVSRYRDRSLIA